MSIENCDECQLRAKGDRLAGYDLTCIDCIDACEAEDMGDHEQAVAITLGRT